jgi:hypothetical protein
MNTIAAKILKINSSNFKCMKYKSTSDTLMQAINIATPTLREPASNQVTVMVIAVRNNSMTRIIPYER